MAILCGQEPQLLCVSFGCYSNYLVAAYERRPSHVGVRCAADQAVCVQAGPMFAVKSSTALHIQELCVLHRVIAIMCISIPLRL